MFLEGWCCYSLLSARRPIKYLIMVILIVLGLSDAISRFCSSTSTIAISILLLTCGVRNDQERKTELL